MKCFKFNLI